MDVQVMQWRHIARIHSSCGPQQHACAMYPSDIAWLVLPLPSPFLNETFTMQIVRTIQQGMRPLPGLMKCSGPTMSIGPGVLLQCSKPLHNKCSLQPLDWNGIRSENELIGKLPSQVMPKFAAILSIPWHPQKKLCGDWIPF